MVQKLFLHSIYLHFANWVIGLFVYGKKLKTGSDYRVDYSIIKTHIEYWINYVGTGDEYRKKHDLDCILTNENLFADTLFSLWLPLRYTLNHCGCERWKEWLEKTPINFKFKDSDEFMNDLLKNIELYLPECEETHLLVELFVLGRRRENVIILPYRKWNNIRGDKPYYDYIQHFLFDMLNTNDERFLAAMEDWIKREHLEMLFLNESITKENLIDLWGSGKVTSHNPKKLEVKNLLKNYIDILKERQKYYVTENS